MPAHKKKHRTIDEYIKAFPEGVQSVLVKIRQTIRKAAPEVEETIRYGIPTFNLHGRYLIYVAAWKDHVALYPVSPGAGTLGKELSPYLTGRGTARLPLDRPIPYDLVKKIVVSRVKERK